jgi:hypothetical protein
VRVRGTQPRTIAHVATLAMGLLDTELICYRGRSCKNYFGYVLELGFYLLRI